VPESDLSDRLLFIATTRGVRVALRVRPAAGRNGIDGVALDVEGAPVLKLRVTAPPEGGKANAAVIKVLAKAWKLPKGRIEIAAGASGRNKTVLVSGDPAALMDRLRAWLTGFKIS